MKATHWIWEMPCGKCGGNLYYDGAEDEVRCFQCGWGMVNIPADIAATVEALKEEHGTKRGRPRGYTSHA